MASSTSTNERNAPVTATVPEAVRGGAFWAAVLLPFCVLALLVLGIETTAEYTLFAALVAANVVALVLGHGYGAESATGR